MAGVEPMRLDVGTGTFGGPFVILILSGGAARVITALNHQQRRFQVAYVGNRRRFYIDIHLIRR